MGAYAKAGLGRGIGAGLQSMGMMLLEAQDRQERRAFQQYQIKAEAQDRKDRREAVEYEKWARKDDYRRAGEVAERAEQKHREEAMAAAQERAEEYQAQGYSAFVNPPAMSIEGDPTDPNAQLRSVATLPAVPKITMGGYDSARDPREIAVKDRAKFFTGQGYGPEGQMPARPTTPDEPSDKWITLAGRKFPNTPEGQAEAIAWQRQVSPPSEGSSFEKRLLAGLEDQGGEGGEGASPRRGSFGMGGGQLGGQEPADPTSEYAAMLKEANDDLRAGNLTREQHAEIVTKIKAAMGMPATVR